MIRDPRSLVWLASYPKSGNTWMRAFLANYFIDSPEPVSINEMQKISFSDSPAKAYADIARSDPARLTPFQLMAVRERHLAKISQRGETVFVKTHNANIRIAGQVLMPPRLTKAAIYIMRDPRDLVISYADHFGHDLAGAAAAIGSSRNQTKPNPRSVTQFLGDWSSHVRGWTRAPKFPILILRYEEMLADPEAAFAKVLRKIGAPIKPDVVAMAAKFASFDVLAAQEAAEGFREKGASQERFFRIGSAGQWRETLPEDIVQRIVSDHGEVMKRHGYLDP